MRLIKSVGNKASGAPQQNKFAYLFLRDDITFWPGTDEGGVYMEHGPKIKPNAIIYRLYTQKKSQEFSFDTIGNHDSRGYKTKFTGTHPGCEQSALEFCYRFLDLGFIVMIPDCENGKTKILGIPDNPLVFTSHHKSSAEGRRFTFTFEQEIDSEEIYMLGDFKPWEDSTFRFFDKYFSKTFE